MSVKSRIERGVVSVNAELPVFMVKQIDDISQKYESSRSGIIRVAVRELIAAMSSTATPKKEKAQ